MPNSKLTTESGTIDIGDQFISVRLIRETLEKYNGISVLNEQADFIKCRVFRIGRLFGGPWIGPYPTIAFKIERTHNNTNLHYQYYWPEYFVMPICSIALGLAIGFSTYSDTQSILSGAKIGFIIASVATILSTVCIHLDVMYFKRLLRKRIKNINKYK